VTTFAQSLPAAHRSSPITSYAYQNIGVNIDITPRTHHDDDVTLQVKILWTAFQGRDSRVADVRQSRDQHVIRLRDGETSMLAGLIRDDERQRCRGCRG